MDLVKKNQLDLEYQKHLQYFNTTVIAMFTYAIGLAIAVFTKQITDPAMVLFVTILTFGVYIFLFWLLLNFRKRMRDCLENISRLKP